MRMTDKSNLLFIFGHYRGIVIKNYIKGNTTSSLRFVERWNSPDIQNGRLVLVNKLQPCLIPTATKTPYWKPFEVMLMCVAFPEQVLAKLGWVIYSASSRLGRSPPRFNISSDSGKTGQMPTLGLLTGNTEWCFTSKNPCSFLHRRSPFLSGCTQESPIISILSISTPSNFPINRRISCLN